MYLYFNKQGDLTTIIPHGEKVRQGSSLNLYVLFDEDFFSSKGEDKYDWNINIKLITPDNKAGLVMIPSEEPILEVFEKTIDSEVTYDLIEGQTYWKYSFHYTPQQATMKYGKLNAAISVLKTVGDMSGAEVEQVQFVGRAEIYVERTFGFSIPPELNITPEQYEQLMVLLNNLDSRKVSRQEFYDRVYEIGLTSVEFIQYLEEHYFVDTDLLDMGDVENFDGTNDKQIPTSKAVHKITPLVVDEVFVLSTKYTDIKVGYTNSIDLDSLNKMPREGEKFWGICKTIDNYVFSIVAEITGEVNASGFVPFKFTEVVLLHNEGLINSKQDKLTPGPGITIDKDNVISSQVVVPTKISAFENDVGYLTEHQDISHLEKGIDDLTLKFGNLSGAFVYQGTLTNIEQLPTPSETNKGHVYIINKKEYASNGSEWVELGDEGSYILKTTYESHLLEQLNKDNKQNAEIAKKVDKVDGKGLSTNDYTTEEKNKLASLENYDDTNVQILITDLYNNKLDKDYAIELITIDFSSMRDFLYQSLLKFKNKEIESSKYYLVNGILFMRINYISENIYKCYFVDIKNNYVMEQTNTIDITTDFTIDDIHYKTTYFQKEINLSNKLKYAYIEGAPTKLSDLTNDTNFIDNTVNNLVNYYLKTETYTKDEVKALVNAINTLTMKVVTELPTTDISTTTIYLKLKVDGESPNIYEEYIYINGNWEMIGTTDIDLSGFALKTELPTKTSQLENDSGYVVEGLLSRYMTRDTTQTVSGNKIFEKPIYFWNESTYIQKPMGVEALEFYISNNLALSIRKNRLNVYGTIGTESSYVPGIFGTNIKGKVIYQNNKQVANKEDIPTKLSRLENDTNYATQEDLNSAIEVAEGKTKTYVITTNDNGSFNVSTDDVVISISGNIITTDSTTVSLSDLKLGDIVLIKELDVPDRYVGVITDTDVTFYKMETSKVDLSGYATKTEVNTMIADYINSNFENGDEGSY